MSDPVHEAKVVLRAQDLGKEYRLYDSPRQRLAALRHDYAERFLEALR